MEGNHRVQGTDNDLMDGETEGDTVVIAGQPEVLSTQAMQVSLHIKYDFTTSYIISHLKKVAVINLVLILFPFLCLYAL